MATPRATRHRAFCANRTLAGRLRSAIVAILVLIAGLPLAPSTSWQAWAQDTKRAPSQEEQRSPSPSGGWSAAVSRRQPQPRPDRPRVTGLRLEGDANRTTVRVQVSRPVVASMFMLDEPYRAIIDVADLDFRLPPGSGTRGKGLVKSYRYGQFAAGRSRMVIDLTGPATIEGATFAAAGPRQPGTLSFDLLRVAPEKFQAMRGSVDPAEAAAAASPELRGGRHEEASPAPTKAPASKRRPVVMLDPGHGGVDPGAVAETGLTEKTVTLAVALHLRNILSQSRRYDVQMTRQTDTFVSLDQRVSQSRRQGADLFVSIHADALAEKELAQAVRGATVYILSERASDDRAGRLAEKENAADVVAGLAAVPASAEDQVRSILFDLVQRETANYSVTVRGLLLSTMRGRVPLAKDPQRSAAFKVLKQPDVPAVLIELGYMSNSQDMARLANSEGQRQLAATIASAVDAFFSKRDAAVGR